MAARSEKLNRLVIGTPCRVSRNAMEGTGAERFCHECNKPVYDFEAMTPRQIEAKIEASRGRLCARITRTADGRLVTLPSPVPPSTWLERRASPVVSALVTALLGLGTAAAKSAPPAPSEISGTLDRAPDSNASLSTSTPTAPELAPTVFPVEDQDNVTEGILYVEGPKALPALFEESDLVVSGVVGASNAIDPEIPSEVTTELRITSVFKGTFSRRSLLIQHAVSEGLDGGQLAPGTRLLAFLSPVDTPQPTYVSADYQWGLKVLSEAELSAYGERIEAFARISRRGEPAPAQLAEWLVATAEEPLTRREVAREIEQALTELNEQVEEDGISPEQVIADFRETAASEDSSDLLGAFITEADKTRLSRALLSTRGITEGDFALYKIIRPWAGDAASEWLLRQFRQTEPLDDGVAMDVMKRLTEELDSRSLAHLIEESQAKIYALTAEILPHFSEAKWLAIQPAVEAAHKELRTRFRRMLGE